ncbi:uncharacterized protein BDZ99DRAFT_516250 [Mytilinidion resinicola]|uniref:C2H2-type domain-containing protein n=1 Tax=Mytilinidion resinicola TaxID=574789 RepID=A0A6A6Z322_9PEZI|nr:uncharacterized protein BDZ99DRAFT_516250 [Mytilinidion resinicola]KAF2815531.1 hypothetical protein BDZ99DRAFT_516250 [Mytilinidion resinicola]
MGPPFTKGYTPVSRRGGKRPGSGRKKKATALRQQKNTISPEDVPQPSMEVNEFGMPSNHQDTGRPTKRMRISDMTFGGEHDNSKEAIFDKALYDLEDYDVVDSDEVLRLSRIGTVPMDEDLDDSEEDELSMLPTPKKAPYPTRRSLGSNHDEGLWTDEIPSESLYAPTRSTKNEIPRFFCSYEDCPQSKDAGGGFATRSQLERHNGVHDPSAKCVWRGCDRVFSQVHSMRDHIKRIHLKGAQDGTVESDVDNAINDEAVNISENDRDEELDDAVTGGATDGPTEVSQNGIFPLSEFRCSYKECPRSKAMGGRKFASRQALQNHEATHNPSIKCIWADCDRIFARIDNMMTHFKKIHSKDQQALQPDVATTADNMTTIAPQQSTMSLDSTAEPARRRGRPRKGAAKTPKEAPEEGPQTRKRASQEEKDLSQAAKEAAQLLNQAANAPAPPLGARPNPIPTPMPPRSDAQAMLEVMKLQGQAVALEAEAKKLQADAWNLRIQARELELRFQSREGQSAV